MASDCEDLLTVPETNVIDEKSLNSQFPKLFFVTKADDAYGIIREYELKTFSRFITYRETKGFGHFLPLAEHFDHAKLKRGHKILWNDGTEVTEKIPFDGVPYILLGSKTMDCMYGPDRCKSLKAKKELAEGESQKKKKKRGESRKVDCPAQIYLREIHKFPEFKIPFNSQYNRRVTSKGLRKALQEDLDIGERRIYVALPRLRAHRAHPVGKESEEKFPLDPRVRDKIFDMVFREVYSTSQLQTEAYEYVRNELFKDRDPPTMTNRRYFPTARVIKSYCYQKPGHRRTSTKGAGENEKPGPAKKGQGSGSSKERGDEGNVAAHSLLLLDQPIREEEVDTTTTNFDEESGDAASADALGQIDNIMLGKDDEIDDFQCAEKQQCLTLINHLKDLTEATSEDDKDTLLEVKGHLLEALNKLHGPLMLATQITENNAAKKRKLEEMDVEEEEETTHQIIPIRFQKDPTTNKHVVIIDDETWSTL